MDLRNNTIRVGELLQNPQVRAIINREFPGLLQNPMVGMARRMPLSRLLQYAQGIYPPEKINRVLREIQAL